MTPESKQHERRKASAKEKLLDAALVLVRERGYAATSVDALCEKAGVTKGAFFHHFKSKEDLAVAAADYWSSMTGRLFAEADYHKRDDPLARVLGYVRFRKLLLQGEIEQITCFVGTMVQEVYADHPRIQQACQASIYGHAATCESDIEEAKVRYAPAADWSAKSLALYIQASIQGAFILAKASGKIDDAIACLDHLECYIKLVFNFDE